MTNYIVEPAKNDQFSHHGFSAEWANTSSFAMVYDVEGFWSQPVTIYIKRDSSLRDMDNFTWTCEVSNSSGGKDTETVEASLQATLNLAAALVDAVATAKLIMERADELEDSFQAVLEADRKAREKYQADRQAARDADPEIGEEAAKVIVKELARKGKAEHEASYHAHERGQDTGVMDVNVINYNGRNTFYFGTKKVSMQRAILRIAASSAAKSDWKAV